MGTGSVTSWRFLRRRSRYQPLPITSVFGARRWNNDLPFCDAIVALSADHQMRQVMGQAGRQRVEKYFRKEKQLEELTEFLLE